MGKALWIAAIVAVVWIGTELMNEGVEGAFGGIFGASDAAVEHVAQQRSTPQRVGDKAQRAHDLRESRINGMLQE
jgi:hypothetical protein